MFSMAYTVHLWVKYGQDLSCIPLGIKDRQKYGDEFRDGSSKMSDIANLTVPFLLTISDLEVVYPMGTVFASLTLVDSTKTDGNPLRLQQSIIYMLRRTRSFLLSSCSFNQCQVGNMAYTVLPFLYQRFGRY